MYVPPAFRADDPDLHREVIDAHPFATLVTAPLFASHLPFLRDGDTLYTHVARANPHARGADDALVVFAGPHAYVSPRWYGRPAEHVPTWNYVAVHVTGPLLPLDRADTIALVRRLTTRFDPEFTLDDALVEQLAGAIVGLRMPMVRVEGKLKLSQNRDPDDAARVRDAIDPAVAAWMARISGTGASSPRSRR
jgi:transcriptional regulator